MHVVRTESDLECLANDELLGLIRSRIAETREYVADFGELVFFVVVQPGDDLHAVDACLGFPVMVNRFTDIPFGHPDFTPSWEVFQEHIGWFELVFVLSDEGAGVQVFVAKEGTPAELLGMCRQYAFVEAIDP